MAVKPILEVEINDDAFKGFKAAHAELQAAIAQSPYVWRDVSKAVAEHTQQFQKATAGVVKHYKVITGQQNELKHLGPFASLPERLRDKIMMGRTYKDLMLQRTLGDKPDKPAADFDDDIPF
jgi:hypothetical protein